MEAAERLQALEGDFQKLRKQLNCHICTELMFEPMVLTGCGHTFCYGCSFDWLKTHKTCPTCRAKVKTKPTPIYLIRELVDVLATRIELQSPFGEGATLRQHQEEQRLIVASHRGDLYPNLFHDSPQFEGGLVDHEDRVMRCINCHWELEGTVCSGCGQDYGSVDSGEDYNYGDTERVDDEDPYASFSDLEDDERPNEYDHEDSFIDNGPSSQLEPATQDDSLLDDGVAEFEETGSYASEGGSLRAFEDVDPEVELDSEGSDYLADTDFNAPQALLLNEQSDDNSYDEFDGFPDDAASEASEDHEGGLDHPIDIASDYETDEMETMDEEDSAPADARSSISHRPRRIICDSDEDESA